MQLSLSQTPKSISSANYLLRQYGGAAAAYSLQRLDTSTTNVVRARRSTDDAESNFTAEGVSGGSLREFALNNDADLIRFADQAAAADKRMYFDGVDDYVDFGVGDPLGFDGAGKITLAFKLVVGVDPAARAYLFGNPINGGSTGINISLETNGTIRAQGRSVSTDIIQGATSTSVITEGAINEIEVYWDFANDEIGININSGGYETTAVTFGNASYTYGSTVNRTTLGAFLLLANYGAGVIYDFSVSKDDVLSSSYQGYGNTNADWTDQIGSNDGTVNGSPALFSGQGFDAYVTTLYDQSGSLGQPLSRFANRATAADQRMYFDGVNDYVDIGTEVMADGATDVSVVVYCSVEEIGTRRCILETSGSYAVSLEIQASGVFRAYFQTDAGDATMDALAVANVGQIYKLEYRYDNGTCSLYVDDVLQNSGSKGTELVATDGFHIGTYRSANARWFKGLIYDISVTVDGTLAHQWNGYGNTNADWTDQVGSNDGTVNGSPTLYEGRNATQATAASQPQIVADGVVVTDANGKPSILFDGSNDGLSATWGILTGASARTFFAVYGESGDATANDDMVSYGSATAAGLSSIGYANGPVFRCTTANDQSSTADAGSIAVVTHTFDGTSNSDNAKLFVNGTKNPAAAVSAGSENTPSTGLFIGQRSNNTVYADGKCSEVVIYGSDKSSDRAAIEANIASRYGITLA